MAPRLHALLLTFPAPGHINPFVQLASNLVSRGCSVTLVDTHRSHRDVLHAAQRDTKAHADSVGIDPSPKQVSAEVFEKDSSPKQPSVGPEFRYFTISDGLPDSFKFDMSSDRLLDVLDGTQRQRGVLEKYIDSSKTSDNPISCIIADSFFSWALDLAACVGLPGAVCLTSNATTMLFACIRHSGKWTREAVERDELVELHNICISKHEIFTLLNVPENSKIGKVYKDLTDGLFKASQVLVNSVLELEDFLNLPESLWSKTRFVGPLLAPELLEAKASGNVHVQTRFFRENMEYARWLDMQGKSSVLFISFGSIANLPPAQLGEIAAGIEESEVKFLWVARPDTEGKTYLPEGFEVRTKGRGRVISWADQLGVLIHPAVGGFITHCGWNSVLESISMGVPMLCLPAFAEQPMNRDLIVNQWKVGMALQNSEGVVTREHVKNAARELMDGMVGKAIKERVNVWKEAARQAISQGGSSYVALTEFIDFVTKDSKARTM